MHIYDTKYTLRNTTLKAGAAAVCRRLATGIILRCDAVSGTFGFTPPETINKPVRRHFSTFAANSVQHFHILFTINPLHFAAACSNVPEHTAPHTHAGVTPIHGRNVGVKCIVPSAISTFNLYTGSNTYDIKRPATLPIHPSCRPN